MVEPIDYKDALFRVIEGVGEAEGGYGFDSWIDFAYMDADVAEQIFKEYREWHETVFKKEQNEKEIQNRSN